MEGKDYAWPILVFSEYHYHYVGVSHAFEAVRVPACEGQAGACEAAQEDNSHQSVHGNNFMGRFL